MTNGRLLWVDDEIEFLRIHILFLEEKGYEVTSCTNGTDAVDLCHEQAFDLIFLDENMPGLSGLQTLERIKQIQPDVPIVMVTKNETEDLMDQAIGQKIADYLLKPVHPKQILLSLKKNIHRREIAAEVTQTAYQKQFAALSLLADEAQLPEDWYEVYRQLVEWELQLEENNSMMAEMLQAQKADANAAFAKFVKKNYLYWLQHEQERPMMSHDVLQRTAWKDLKEGKRVFMIVFDNFRYDQWRMLRSELAPLFDVEEQLYTAILPTATQYARNAIFAGMLPRAIKETYPHLWVDEEQEEGKNLKEGELLEAHLQRMGMEEVKMAYHKLNDSLSTKHYLEHFHEDLNNDLNVLVINFIDILSHARTESQMVRELASTEAAYRSITMSWLNHSSMRELFLALAETDYEVMITTDHGSIRVNEPTKVVGDKRVNTNLRYKYGKALSYNKKEVMEVVQPIDYGLPTPHLSTRYIFAVKNRFFAYPNNYNHYVPYYRDTFQHGGVSMEEMLVPLVRLKSKNRR